MKQNWTKLTLNVARISWVLSPYAFRGKGPGIFAKELPVELKKMGINTSVIVPEHPDITKKLNPSPSDYTVKPVTLDNQETPVLIKEKKVDGINIFSVGNSEILQSDSLYHGEDLLRRILFFSLGSLRLLALLEENKLLDLIELDDWPAGLIAAFINSSSEKRFFSEKKPVLFYSYNPDYRGSFPKNSHEFNTFGLKDFHSPALTTKHNDLFSLFLIARHYTDQVIDVEHCHEAPDIPNLAREAIGHYRSNVKIFFEGMENALPKENLPEWDLRTPQENLELTSTYVYDIYANLQSLPAEDRQLILTAAEWEQEHIFKEIKDNAAFKNILADLKRIDCNRFTAALKYLKEYAINKGRQIDGQPELIASNDHLITDFTVSPPDKALITLGKQNIGKLAWFSLSAASDFELYWKVIKDVVPVSAKEIEGLNASFFGITAGEILKVQEKYQCVIPWYMLLPMGKRAEYIRAHFRSFNYFGLDEKQVHLLEDDEENPVFDHQGKLLLDESGMNMVFSPVGSGKLLKRLKKDGILDKLLAGGYTQGFASNICNIGADISFPLFFALLGWHLEKGNGGVSVELVEQDNHEQGGFPVRYNGKPQILENYLLPVELLQKARFTEALFSDRNYFIDLAALNRELLPDTSLYFRLRSGEVGKQHFFEMKTPFSSITGLLPVNFVQVDREERFIAPNGLTDNKLKKIAGQYRRKQEKHHAEGI